MCVMELDILHLYFILLCRLMCVFVQSRTERATLSDPFDAPFALVTGESRAAGALVGAA